MADLALTFDPQLLNMRIHKTPKAKTKRTPKELAALADTYYSLREQRLSLNKAVQELERQSAVFFHILEEHMSPDEVSSIAGYKGVASVEWRYNLHIESEYQLLRWLTSGPGKKYDLAQQKWVIDKEGLLELLGRETPPTLKFAFRTKYKHLKVNTAPAAKAAKK